MPKPYPDPSWRSRWRALQRTANASRSTVGSGTFRFRWGSHLRSQSALLVRTSRQASKSASVSARSMTRRPNSGAVEPGGSAVCDLAPRRITPRMIEAWVPTRPAGQDGDAVSASSRAAMPSRMSDSDTSSSSAPVATTTASSTTSPPTMTSARAASMPTTARRSSTVRSRDLMAPVEDPTGGHPVVVHGVALVGGEAEVDRGERGDGASQADQRVGGSGLRARGREHHPLPRRPRPWRG